MDPKLVKMTVGCGISHTITNTYTGPATASPVLLTEPNLQGLGNICDVFDRYYGSRRTCFCDNRIQLWLNTFPR
jgi:hypothetical protein